MRGLRSVLGRTVSELFFEFRRKTAHIVVADEKGRFGYIHLFFPEKFFGLLHAQPEYMAEDGGLEELPVSLLEFEFIQCEPAAKFL